MCGSQERYYEERILKMKRFPWVLIVLLAIMATLILSLLIYRLDWLPKDEILVKYDEINAYFENESDFDKIISFIEMDLGKSRFIQISLEKLAQNEDLYSEKFESRYPRFHEFKKMERELSRNDFSDWIASVISGDTATEFEYIVFEYLQNLKEDRYIKQAVSRFINIAKNLDNYYNDYENYLATVLYLYIDQFPRNASLRQEIIKNKTIIQSLGNKDTNISNSKLFYYLSLKNFGVEEFISQRLSTLKGKEKLIDGKYPITDISDVNFLINDFVTHGKNVPEYFFPLFQMAINRESPTYLYIAMKVFKEIGFNDPELQRWLSRDYRDYKLIIYEGTDEQINRAVRKDREEEERKRRQEEEQRNRELWNLLFPDRPRITIPGITDFGPLTIKPYDFSKPFEDRSEAERVHINFPDEARTVKEIIQTRTRPEYNTYLKNNSGKSNVSYNHFSPPATIMGEIQDEFNSYIYTNQQYTNNDIAQFISNDNTRKDNLNFLTLFILFSTLIPAIIITVFINKSKYLLAWVPLLIVGHLVLFMSVKKVIDVLDLSVPIIIYIFPGYLLTVLLIKVLYKPSIGLYKVISNLCGETVNFKKSINEEIDNTKYTKKSIFDYFKKKKIDIYFDLANNGDTNIQEKLGKYYYKGYGNVINKDSEKSFYWFTKAAENGLVTSQYFLAGAYATGLNGLKRDHEKAKYWIVRAIKNGLTYQSRSNIYKILNPNEVKEFNDNIFLLLGQINEERIMSRIKSNIAETSKAESRSRINEIDSVKRSQNCWICGRCGNINHIDLDYCSKCNKEFNPPL
jgi:hypothetical protein